MGPSARTLTVSVLTQRCFVYWISLITTSLVPQTIFRISQAYNIRCSTTVYLSHLQHYFLFPSLLIVLKWPRNPKHKVWRSCPPHNWKRSSINDFVNAGTRISRSWWEEGFCVITRFALILFLMSTISLPGRREHALLKVRQCFQLRFAHQKSNAPTCSERLTVWDGCDTLLYCGKTH